MHKSLSISRLILPLFALAAAHCLSAQTLVIDKPTLTFSGQVGTSAVIQTITVTSSTGASIPFALFVPQAYSWLKVSKVGEPGTSSAGGNTPLSLTVTADPTGLAAGTYPASPPATINVTSGSSETSIAVTFTVSTIGVNPQSLAFTYTQGSDNFPVAQNVALSSAATQCTATAATSTGGNWIGPLQNPCVSPSTLSVPISNSVVAFLAPNTYTGTITIAPPAGQGPPALVSVTLTVLPTPPVTVNPPSLVLNWQTGIAAPNPTQTFTIATTASQALGFTISQNGQLTNTSTFSPSTFGSISANSPAQIAYTVVNPSGLAVGTYRGTILLNTPGGSPQQTNIPVTLNVSNTPLLNVPNTTLNFAAQANSTPAPQTVNITSTGSLLSYTVTTSNYTPSAYSAWLTVNTSGTTAAPFAVSVNPGALPVGTYSAIVNVFPPTQGSPAQQFQVVLKVTNDPVISASLNALSFPYQMGQTPPAARSVKVTSSTGVPLKYAASLAPATCGSAWLLLNGGSDTINGVTPPNDTFTVSVAIAGLSAGTCTGKVNITATDPSTGAAALGSPLNIDVTLFVSTAAQLVLTPPDPLVFTSLSGTQPAANKITLTSTSSDVLNYSVGVQTTDGANWLFFGPQSGTTIANNVLTVFVSPIGLAARTYTGTVNVIASGPGGAVANSPLSIPVTFTVTAGSLTLSATNLNFPDQTLGGPAPASQTVTIGSDGQPLNYNAVVSPAASWLSVSPASGTTSSILTIAVDGSKLTPGSYTGTIVVTAPGAGNSPTITVHFKVNPGALSAPNTTLNFTQAVGGPAPAPQGIAVTGSPAPLNYTAVSTTLNGVSWLTVTPASGTTPSSVQVSVNGATLPVGQYTGKVTIASAGAAGSPIDVGVILNVVAPAILAASPASLSFNYTIGLAAPASQNLAVTSTGNAPVTAQVQLDGAAVGWLSVAPAASSVTPATFAVSVTPSALPAGKYTGRIVIASPLALVTATIPVTFIVTAIPQPVVVEVRNAASYLLGGISPGEMIWIKGGGLGPATLTYSTIANNAFSTTVANTRVLFDNVAAPIIYASDSQTSVLVPYGVGGRTSTNIVVEYFGVQSAAVSYNIVAAAPGIYTQNSQGTGPASVLNQNNVLNGPNTPEKRGNVIAVYMTGEGATNPQGSDGAIIPADGSLLKKPIQTVTATIGGIAADVQYAGSAPSLVSGVMQVNLLIPPNAPTGSAIPVVINVGTASTAAFGAPTVAISQ